MRRKKRTSNGQIFGYVVATLLFLMLVAIVVGGYHIYEQMNGRVRAAHSVERITEDVWQLTYNGDYYFNELLASGGAASDSMVGEFLSNYMGKKARRIGKTSLDLKTKAIGAQLPTAELLGASGEFSLGAKKNPGIMLVMARPDSGYSSVSTVYLDYLQLGAKYVPTRGFLDKMLVLTTIYFPTDGMNDQGLSVVDIPQDEKAVDYNTQRPDLTTYTCIRMLLDRCSNVQEAQMMLRRFDVHPSGGVAHQLMLRDASGQTSLVSWEADGKLSVVPDEVDVRHLYDSKALRDLMKQGAEEGKTQWSVRYELQTATATWWFRNNYDLFYSLSLND